MAPITEIAVTAYKVPTDFPESDGTYEWDSTTMVIVELSAGDATGIGYTYADLGTASVIRNDLAEAILGRDASSIPELFQAMNARLRNLGNQAIGSMAISAVDIALWDWKAKYLNQSLTDLLGQCRPTVPIYGSGGFTSYSIKQLQEQLGNWAAQGIPRVKMKIGRDAAADCDRVQKAREAIGENTELMVDANGAYSVKQAIAQAADFEANRVTWFEEPVPSSDPAGLRFIRERTSCDIAAGEYGYLLTDFLPLLHSVDVLQADATRCQGITGFLKAATVAESAKRAISAHCGPTAHLHLGTSVPNFKHLEYFHDHVRIERLFFDGFVEPTHGVLLPNQLRPGLGIALKRREMECYKIGGD